MEVFVDNKRGVCLRKDHFAINNSMKMPKGTINPLIKAADGINNYAKANKTQISISPVTHNISSEGADSFIISGQKTGKDGHLIVCDVLNTKAESQKPFLRQVYEKIQYVTEGTEPRIEKMKEETLNKLRKIGKIK